MQSWWAEKIHFKYIYNTVIFTIFTCIYFLLKLLIWKCHPESKDIHENDPWIRTLNWLKKMNQMTDKKTIILKTKLFTRSWSRLSLTFRNRVRWWVILVFGHLEDRWGCGDGFLCWRLTLTDVQVSTVLWGWVNASEDLSHGNTRERHVWTSIGPGTEGQIYNGHAGLQLQTEQLL